MKSKISYKDSGVNINEGNKFVKKIQPYVKKTLTSQVIGNTTSFAALFSLKKERMKDPILVACTDGVGTKIEVGIKTNKIRGLGTDLVAMSINDLICTSAKPLFFLDYLATSKLKVDYHAEIIKGIVDGCLESDCSLIGGETAEMPGMYDGKDFDLAGFAVGIVDKKDIYNNSKIKSGDLLIGIPSSGIHSNGYSLVRKLFFSKTNSFSSDSRFVNTIMKPTRIYSKLFSMLKNNVHIKGVAHITGGGLVENIPRILPDGLGVELESNSWPVQKIFRTIQENSSLSSEEMFNIFNMGLGIVICVDKKNLTRLQRILAAKKEKHYIVGKVTNSSNFSII
jgi:phosphoribosylformylglycinamidine cyclo-ligase|tara:strand:+ start:5325 stop:6338 length:1014 start_codon:yes stop_codon:yes gene_type:complete